MTEKINTNCLEGMSCPECGSLGPFDIAANTTVTICDSGSDYHTDLEWGEHSMCLCCDCQHESMVMEFKQEKTKYTVILLYPPPWPNDSPETYTAHTEAKNSRIAALNVQKMAETANSGEYDHEEFEVIAVYQGHLEAEWTAGI